jgi:uncharacterized NAD(P)/FAD-binding protein YdhS
MSAYPYPVVVGVAIIGGGAAGTLAAIQLLHRAQAGTTLALIEPAPVLGQGVAYATGWEQHLLNVPAGKMSAFAAAAEDFLDYLMQQPAFADEARAEVATRYVPRLHYAGYLALRLQQAQAVSPAQLQVIHERVTSMRRVDGGLELQLDSGARLQACNAVLAVGNALRPLPARGAEQLSARQLVQAWDFDAVQGIDPDAAVCIVGSGLSMADSIVSLLANDHRGPVHVISRHALLPLPHADAAPAAFDPQPLLAMRLRQRMRVLRQHVADAAAAGLPWQSVMDRLRPHGQALWLSLDEVEQRRFLRHVVRYWDVHRHRIAAPVHAQLLAMRERGQLQLHRGRLDAVSAEAGKILVAARDADGVTLPLLVDCVINATGVEMRAQSMRNGLLQQMLADGEAAPGPHGIGINTDVDGNLLAADGEVINRLQVIGSLRIGRLWESLAIPELRQQAQLAAQRLIT